MAAPLLLHKEVHDTIHGYIKLSAIAIRIIDTRYFQKLRQLHQLGTCYYVFPNATHTRFEHSIGTYHLAGKALERIIINSNPDHIVECIKGLGIKGVDRLNTYVIELVKIAALCHDLGHGPFSHVFDDIFLANLGTSHPMHSHEARSEAILRHIIKADPVLSDIICDDHITFICNIINPLPENNGFIYQIVSNCLNSIDVDKFDYLTRDTNCLGLPYGIDASRLIQDMKVIDNIICYPKKIHMDIISLFENRYRLHKQIYSHKAAVAIQYMINDIMMLLNDYMNISDSITKIDDFTDLTEEYIFTCMKILNRNLPLYNQKKRDDIVAANALYDRIIKRNLYKLVGNIVSKHALVFTNLIGSDKLICHRMKIGFVSGSKENPLDRLYFYEKMDSDKWVKLGNNDVSMLVPTVYQEYIYMFYLKDKHDTETLQKFQEFYKKIEK